MSSVRNVNWDTAKGDAENKYELWVYVKAEGTWHLHSKHRLYRVAKQNLELWGRNQPRGSQDGAELRTIKKTNR